jgi:hypothetical protein
MACPRGPASAAPARRARLVPGAARPRRDRGTRVCPGPPVPASPSPASRPWRARATPYFGRGAARPRRPRHVRARPPPASRPPGPTSLAVARSPAPARPPSRPVLGAAVAMRPRRSVPTRPRPRRSSPSRPYPRNGSPGPAWPWPWRPASPRPRLGNPLPLPDAPTLPLPGHGDPTSPVPAWRGTLRAPSARPAPAPTRRAWPWRPPAPACPAPAQRVRGVSALARPGARPGVPMARGLELGRRTTPRVRLRRGLVAARGTHRDMCAARPCARVLVWCTRCFGTARHALGALVHLVPVYPPYTLCVVIPLFISINRTQFRNWLR